MISLRPIGTPKRGHDVLQEELRAKNAALQRTEPHISYGNVVSAALHATNGVPRKPMELVEVAEAAASAQVGVDVPCPLTAP